MTSSTQITFIRHGAVHNPDDIIYGRLPGFRLSEIGQQQIAATARALVESPLPSPDAIFTSPQLRARQSAEIIQVQYPDLEIITDPLIDEIDIYFEGHPSSELAKRGWDLYSGVEDDGDHHYDTPITIAARGAQFVASIRDTHASQHVLAVTHGDIIAFTVLWAMQEPLLVKLKRTLHRFGIIDRYPVTASLTTLSYHSPNAREIPDLTYYRPYDENLVRPALS